MTSPSAGRRRAGPGRLALAGLGLVTLAVLLWIPAALTSMDYYWPDEAMVAGDGSARRMAAEPGDVMFVWTWGATVEPHCSVADADGEPVRLDVVDTYYARGGGPVPWVARWSFVAPGAQVDVTCRAGADRLVMVEERPLLPAPFVGMSWLAWIDLLSLVAGLLSLLAALVLLAHRAVLRTFRA